LIEATWRLDLGSVVWSPDHKPQFHIMMQTPEGHSISLFSNCSSFLKAMGMMVGKANGGFANNHECPLLDAYME
jgi:hypothetical protein